MNFNWSKYLTPDESLQMEFSVSNSFRTGIIIASIIISVILLFTNILVALVVLLLGLLDWFYLKKAKHYAFTNKRIILIESFIGESIVSIDYNQITDIEINQSAFDQIGGWGTLTINTAGTHVPEVNLSFINDPQRIKQKLDQIRDSVKTSNSAT